MKKQTKILIGAVVVVVVIIIVLAINFPPVFIGKSSGTFAKADKYHKSQMTEKDVQLRSELTADTAKLKGMIQGLMYFAVFTQNLSTQIDSCVHVYQYNGLTNQEAGYKNMMALNDFSIFIRNNNKTLGNTIGLLSGFYFKDKADQSADVEKDLREFHNYVKTLSEKDSIFEMALMSLDKFIVSNKVIKEHKTEFTKLKSIRDQLLIKTIQFGALVLDRPLTATMCAYVLQSQQQIQAVWAKENLADQFMAQDKLTGHELAQEKLSGQFRAQDKLTAAAQETGFGMIPDNLRAGFFAKNDLSASNWTILYDKANLQFITLSRADLAAMYSNAQVDAINATNLVNANALNLDFTGVFVMAQDGLKVCASPVNLQVAYQLVPIEAVFSSEQLKEIVAAQQNIGIVAGLCATALQQFL